ncbi:hypothetical protein PAPYR_7526 [Paratrimastix pyriformis]|uniref:Ig-like domain-containing protein n=1 Tax=Paratrimastix pyriformis TaxID=342808 RepID=A0ABQ8UCK3_9EUKA|nr:hypothetical protein PAPYR_7526 [Paratrimastix pyriformis]
MGKGCFRTALAMLHDPFGVSGKQRVNDLHLRQIRPKPLIESGHEASKLNNENLRIHEERSSASLRCTAWASERASRHGIDEVQHDLRRAMACEITAVNDDLDDATIAFIEKHASILDEEDPFLCFIDELDDHRAIFRSMDQLSRLSFTSTMILKAHPVDQAASAHQFEHSTVGGGRSISVLSKACAIDSIHLWCHHFQFGVFQQARYCIASIDGDPVPARPVASVNPSIASPQSGLCPKSPSTVKQPPGKVTAHCIDPQLPRFSLRWYKSATPAIP